MFGFIINSYSSTIGVSETLISTEEEIDVSFIDAVMAAEPTDLAVTTPSIISHPMIVY